MLLPRCEHVTGSLQERRMCSVVGDDGAMIACTASSGTSFYTVCETILSSAPLPHNRTHRQASRGEKHPPKFLVCVIKAALKAGRYRTSSLHRFMTSKSPCGSPRISLSSRDFPFFSLLIVSVSLLPLTLSQLMQARFDMPSVG